MTNLTNDKTNETSKCCNAPVSIEGIGDFREQDEVCTQHYSCTKCGKPCDLIIKKRIKMTEGVMGFLIRTLILAAVIYVITDLYVTFFVL